MPQEQQVEAGPAQATANWTKSFGEVLSSNPEATKTDERPTDANGGSDVQPAPAAPPAASKAVESKSSEKAPEKPADTQPNPPGENSPDKWPRTAKEWKKFIDARDSALKERDEKIKSYEQKLKELDAASAAAKANFDTSEVEAIKKERDDLSERMRLVSIERHPRFENYFKGQTTAQIELAKKIVGQERAEQVEELLNMPNGKYKSDKLDELMNDLTPMQLSRLGGVLNSMEMIERERQTEIERAKSDYQRLAQSEQAEREKRVKEAESIFSKTVEEFQGKDGMAVFQLRDGDEAWNKRVQKSVEEAKSLMFGNVPPNEISRAALKASAFPTLLEMYGQLMDEKSQLEEQVKALSNATPSMDGSKSTSAAPRSDPAAKSGMSPMQASRAWFDSLQQAMGQE